MNENRLFKIYFIRHGKTESNLRGLYVGTTDERLSENGREELENLRPSLLSKTGEPPLIFSSPMKRCLETAALLYPVSTPIIEYDLREFDFGEFEGRSYEELKNVPAFIEFRKNGGLTPVPGGDDPAVFTERCVRCLIEIAGKINEVKASSCAVVCHGGVIMALMSAFYGNRADFYKYYSLNGGGYTVLWDGVSRRFSEVSPL